MADYYVCWARTPSGQQRLEVAATTEQDARRLAFRSCPAALAV